MDANYRETRVAEVFAGLAASVRNDPGRWLSRFDSRHFLKRRVPDLLESLGKYEQFKDSLSELVHKLLDDEELNVSSSLLRHHFFAYGLYGRDKRDYAAFISEADVVTLSEKVGNRLVGWVGTGDAKLTTVISSQTYFIARELGMWTDIERQAITKLLDDPESLMAIMLVFYDGQGRTEFSALNEILDRSIFLSRLQAFRQSKSFDGLDPGTLAGFAKATSD